MMGPDISNMKFDTCCEFEYNGEDNPPEIDAVRKAIGLGSSDVLACLVYLSLNEARYHHPRVSCIKRYTNPLSPNDWESIDIVEAYERIDPEIRRRFEMRLLLDFESANPIDREVIAKELEECRAEAEATFCTPVGKIATGEIYMSCTSPDFTNSTLKALFKEAGYDGYEACVYLAPEKDFADVYELSGASCGSRISLLWADVPSDFRIKAEALLIAHAWQLLPELLEQPPVTDYKGCWMIPDVHNSAYETRLIGA